MAGNWKMNLNHLEANLLVQKLAASLTEKQLTAVETVVLPPFTDLRTVQTAGGRRQAAHRLRRAGPVPARVRRVHRGHLRADAGQARLHVRGGRPLRAAGRTTTRTTRWSTPRSRRRWRNGLTPILCVGEGLDIREQGSHVAHCSRPARRGAWPGSPPSRCGRSWSRTSRSGRSARARRPPRRTPRRSAGRCVSGWRRRYDQETADQVRVLYGGSVKASNIASIMAPAGRGRGAGGGRQPGRGGIRADLPVPGAHRAADRSLSLTPPVRRSVPPCPICPGEDRYERTDPSHADLVRIHVDRVAGHHERSAHHADPAAPRQGRRSVEHVRRRRQLQPGRLLGRGEEPGPLHRSGGRRLVRLHRRARALAAASK